MTNDYNMKEKIMIKNEKKIEQRTEISITVTLIVPSVVVISGAAMEWTVDINQKRL